MYAENLLITGKDLTLRNGVHLRGQQRDALGRGDRRAWNRFGGGREDARLRGAYEFQPDDAPVCTADLNDDGMLNFFDISAFLSAFSAGCP